MLFGGHGIKDRYRLKRYPISYGEFGCDIFYIAISDIYGENMHSHQQSSMYILLGDWIIILCCGFFVVCYQNDLLLSDFEGGISIAIIFCMLW